MENNITQKKFDCDHNCTYDSDRKMKEVTVNADGTKTVKTGYRKPQRCKSGRASEARHQGRRRSFLLRALDNVASEVLLLSRRAKNISENTTFLEYTVGDVQNIGEHKVNLLILYLNTRIALFFIQLGGKCVDECLINDGS